MDMMQKLEEINGMLGIFQNYWPTFKIQSGQVEAWAYALKDYDRQELWESIKQFSTEEGRVFAPSISELIGRTDTLRDIAKRKQSDRLALEAPKKTRNEYSGPEEYTYKTARTTPKKNKDDSDSEVRKAVRMNHERKLDVEKLMRDAGYRKTKVPLVNGLVGFIWERL